ncbi:helicase C-terminal domain-containing protein [Sphaerosporella brunnea]|uniref:ATP-dependent DNA helicase CHL1 n=1 Tax=Sphaerosporella brunnea TaxID=1250544 RepID=A0A5J5F2Q7_9PEZI|nr:helicase C-terminal domain-containing protein [Sphaerosporella brunnea]
MENQRDFHHPYTPYPIQLEFMNALYDAIEDGCVGIFESPTGEWSVCGKSLSLICGALTWLREHKDDDLKQQLAAEENASGQPAWVIEHAKQEKKEKFLRARTELNDRLQKIRETEAREKAALAISETRFPKKLVRLQLSDNVEQKKNLEVEVEDEDDEQQFILDDYESDGGTMKGEPSDNSDGFSPAVRELMMKLGMPVLGSVPKEDPTLEYPDETKIFFCSRTHSQLSQFVNELRRVKLSSPLPNDLMPGLEDHIKHLSLGSRRNLCINPRVAKLNSVTAINEKCLELQKSGTSQEKRCMFLPRKDDRVAFRDFRDHALATIHDIEDLSKLGQALGTCPYYASRGSIKPSEIVTLPYPLLLQKSAREALGISLKGHVVIIDEAHNLIDSISSIHSVVVTLPQLHLCKEQLELYLSKFRNRLKGSNKIFVMQISRLLDGLADYVEGLASKGSEGEVNPGDLLAAKGIDQINFFKLQQYLKESKLARKLDAYVLYAEQKNADQLHRRRKPVEPLKPKETVPVLTHLQGFLMALTNPSDEGKIFFGRTEMKEPCLKYMLLDPAYHFKDVVEEARAVILAGGTMQPMREYVTHLFPYLPMEKIRTLSCGHVIPKENLLASPLVKGPTGREFEFTFNKRMDTDLIEELGRAITNICAVIPHGVVCFFPSYAYLDVVVSQWQKPSKTAGLSLWERLGQRKQIFRESKEASSVEHTLEQYSQAIDCGKGAILLSVVGGKMSEGINFNDNLGRGIIMIGLPFPNAHTPEWQAKLKHVEHVAYSSYETLSSDPQAYTNAVPLSDAQKRDLAKAAGREFYENACMRAVNQSIGRAIRHREDYATIILIDKRYANKSIQDKLPGWIKAGLVNIDVTKGEGRFADLMKGCGTFFRAKKA